MMIRGEFGDVCVVDEDTDGETKHTDDEREHPQTIRYRLTAAAATLNCQINGEHLNKNNTFVFLSNGWVNIACC